MCVFVESLVFVGDKSSESETTPSEPVNRTMVSLDLLPLALSPEAVLNTDPLRSDDLTMSLNSSRRFPSVFC